jgi:FixJ family two-component response regulator
MSICRRFELERDNGTFPPRSNDRIQVMKLRSVRDLHIAIVDDDEPLRSSLVDLMRSVGYRAEPFASGEALLMSPNLLSFDCVVADVHMPGMGGFNLVRQFQQQGAMTPVILITDFPDRHLDDEAITVGAQCLLRKPFEATTLINYVERSFSDERPPR